jgi:hypothetical protein
MDGHAITDIYIIYMIADGYVCSSKEGEASSQGRGFEILL